jgi:hypothetical protein
MSMIKKSSWLIFLVFICAISKSQELENSTKVAYGNFTLNHYLNTNSQILPENYSRDDIKSKGALFISYSHLFTERISSGASLGSNKITSDVVFNNQTVGILNRYLYTLAIESDLIYYKKQNFQIYGVLGYGYSMGKDEYFLSTGETDEGFVIFMVFQVSPLSVRVGNRFALFGEFGFGYKGIINFGFTYMF